VVDCGAAEAEARHRQRRAEHALRDRGPFYECDRDRMRSGGRLEPHLQMVVAMEHELLVRLRLFARRFGRRSGQRPAADGELVQPLAVETYFKTMSLGQAADLIAMVPQQTNPRHIRARLREVVL